MGEILYYVCEHQWRLANTKSLRVSKRARSLRAEKEMFLAFSRIASLWGGLSKPTTRKCDTSDRCIGHVARGPMQYTNTRHVHPHSKTSLDHVTLANITMHRLPHYPPYSTCSLTLLTHHNHSCRYGLLRKPHAIYNMTFLRS